MIKVEGLTKRYGPTIAVNNISFDVDRGEIVGFLGPNGAGKTTTMRILTGFLPPTLGKATVAGFDVTEQPIEVKKRIGYLPETPPLYPEMEVVEFLDFVARLKGIAGPEIAGRIDSVLERCSLGQVRHKIIGHLSRGYRQRVGLAQALIHSPDVLILDEPTAGLDPKQIIDVRKLIHALSGEHTIILSTHILPEVAGTCSRVLIINEGRLEASDTPENLTARLQGHESLWLDVDGPEAEIEPALNAVPGVTRVIRENGHAHRTSWQVETANDAAIRSQIARAVVERGWGLYEIRPIGLSLEDIFLKLTAKEEGVEQAALETSGGSGTDAATAPSVAGADSTGAGSGGAA
jgi:gliding motility-associated transport system ATP-binding protein